jgi:hypothetical protein
VNSDSRLLADPACGHRLSRRRERLRCTPSVDFAAESSGSESAAGAVEVGSAHELLAEGRMLAYVGETEVLVVRTRRSELSQCPNVYMKIGGIGMPPMGVGRTSKPYPPQARRLRMSGAHWCRMLCSLRGRSMPCRVQLPGGPSDVHIPDPVERDQAPHRRPSRRRAGIGSRGHRSQCLRRLRLGGNTPKAPGRPHH